MLIIQCRGFSIFTHDTFYHFAKRKMREKKLKEEQDIKAKSIQALRSLKNKLTKLESEILSKESVIQELNSSVDDVKSQLRKAENEITDQKSQIKDLNSKLAESARITASLHKTISEKHCIRINKYICCILC